MLISPRPLSCCLSFELQHHHQPPSSSSHRDCIVLYPIVCPDQFLLVPPSASKPTFRYHTQYLPILSRPRIIPDRTDSQPSRINPTAHLNLPTSPKLPDSLPVPEITVSNPGRTIPVQLQSSHQLFQPFSAPGNTDHCRDQVLPFSVPPSTFYPSPVSHITKVNCFDIFRLKAPIEQSSQLPAAGLVSWC